MVPDVVPCHWRKGGPILLAGDTIDAWLAEMANGAVDPALELG